MINLFKFDEPGSYYDKLDPRAGRFEVHSTTITDFEYDNLVRENIKFSSCPDDLDGVLKKRPYNIDTLLEPFEYWDVKCYEEG